MAKSTHVPSGAANTRAKRIRAQRVQPPKALEAQASHTAMAHCLSLARQLSDQLIEMSLTLNAYLGLERVISPEYADESQANVPLSRTQLGAMLRSFNAQMLRQIQMHADAMAVLQAQLLLNEAQAK